MYHSTHYVLVWLAFFPQLVYIVAYGAEGSVRLPHSFNTLTTLPWLAPHSTRDNLCVGRCRTAEVITKEPRVEELNMENVREIVLRKWQRH